MVCTKSVGAHVAPVEDSLTRYVYEPLDTMSKL